MKHTQPVSETQRSSKANFSALSPHFLRFLSLMEHLCDDSPMSHHQCEFILCLEVNVVVCCCHGVAEIVNEPHVSSADVRFWKLTFGIETETLLQLLYCGKMQLQPTCRKYPFK